MRDKYPEILQCRLFQLKPEKPKTDTHFFRFGAAPPARIAQEVARKRRSSNWKGGVKRTHDSAKRLRVFRFRHLARGHHSGHGRWILFLFEWLLNTVAGHEARYILVVFRAPAASFRGETVHTQFMLINVALGVWGCV